ncbi:hypothetical protein, partial [Methylobacter sp.]|uniref:hypothetical protein n=1 Tax=Methylobacter sp. TaxID=2051955 RepID=UPI003DA394E0
PLVVLFFHPGKPGADQLSPEEPTIITDPTRLSTPCRLCFRSLKPCRGGCPEGRAYSTGFFSFVKRLIK